MTIVLNLPPEKEAELQARAAARGQGVEDYVLAVALPAPEQRPEQKFVPPPYDKAAAIALIRSWRAETDVDAIREQQETLAYLEKVVDEDRPGQRSAFGKGYNPPADTGGRDEL